MSRSSRIPLLAVPFLAAVAMVFAGCATSGGKAMEAHRRGISDAFEEDYMVPKKPVDRHYIGAAWSRQFGPVEDPSLRDIRVKKDRSLNAVQQEYAVNLGISLGAQTVQGAAGEVRLGGGSTDRARLEGVEIISPVSLADIPFEPDVPYVTEALRLANFRIKGERSIGLSGMAVTPTASTLQSRGLDTGVSASGGTEGEGLVVAYKLHTIDRKSYAKEESGSLPIELDKSMDLPKAGIIVKPRLLVIDPGAGKPLPRNLFWACARADAQSRDILAAWLVEVRPTDPKRKALTIAFPAQPKIDDCSLFSGTISSRIDPLTDRIHRQKLQVTLVEGEVNDQLQPERFDARLSVVDESFNIHLVNPSDLGGGGR